MINGQAVIQRVNSSSCTSSSSIPKQMCPNPHLNPAPIRSHQQFRQPFTANNAANRAGAPPPIPPISQPSSFFSFDSLPPLNPSQPPISVSVEEKNGAEFNPPLPLSPFTMCHSSSSRNAGDGESTAEEVS